MIQPAPVPATPLIDRLRAGAGRRTLGFALALLMELLLLLVLLSLNPGDQPGEEESRITVVNFDADQSAGQAPRLSTPEPEPRAPAQTAQQAPQPNEPVPDSPAQPAPPSPAQPAPAPAQPSPPLPSPNPVPSSRAPSAPTPPAAGRPAGSARPMYGPPAPSGSTSLDTERVGTAPNGEPLYAAAWHTRPRPDQLRGYLATASGPGWGLIACRTAPGFRVEDCVPLSEYPAGSQINRAVLAAAWEFKVRPPRIGGRSLVGSWVRIRIDYGIERRR
ncbi:MAG TPA: hypothetical protein VF552_05230 [Allosphingosinicella sp.]